MKRIMFYTTASGRCPVQEHFDTLPDKTVQKIVWVLRVVRDLEHVPSQYLKKLVNTEDIWEVRVDVGRNTLRAGVFLRVRIDRVDKLVPEEDSEDAARRDQPCRGEESRLPATEKTSWMT
jgi:hypothetical protein